MLQASDYERRLIAYDLHDGLTQYLSGAIMQFQAADDLRPQHPREAGQARNAGMRFIQQGLAEARRVISEIRPPVIDEIGLPTALSHLVCEQRRPGGPQVDFQSDVQFERLTPVLENALYRIAQEALVNARKHSQSERIQVSLIQQQQAIRLEVRDWGVGFDPQAVREDCFGLEGIRERVRLLGGQMTLHSAPDAGTRLEVIVPLHERPAES
jgi:two-component system sensor histidine kinase DegS